MTGEVTFTVELTPCIDGPEYYWQVNVDGKRVDWGFTRFHWLAFRRARKHAKRYRGER